MAEASADDRGERNAEGETSPAVTLCQSTAVELLRDCARRAELADLIYIDPPYFTGRAWMQDNGRGALAFDDRWDGGPDDYRAAMREMVVAAHGALNDEGALLLHIDPRVVPWIALDTDEVFGAGERLPGKTRAGYRHQLIWRYGLGGSSSRAWPRKHDVILWYTRSARWYFAAPRVPATSARLKGQMKKHPDVLDVPSLNNMAKERTGYPTQKPLALLELLIGAHCPPGGLVVDPAAGSGTTGMAAARLGRRALLGDRGEHALSTMRARFADAGVATAERTLPSSLTPAADAGGGDTP